MTGGLNAEVVFTSADPRPAQIAAVSPTAVDSEVCELTEVARPLGFLPPPAEGISATGDPR